MNTESQWSTLCVLTTTVSSVQEAQELARSMVREQVAACVQIEAIESHYVWEGDFCATPEWRLVCKTLPDAAERLADWIRAHHSYALPQITMRTERCQLDYQQWLQSRLGRL